jgi:hypothetical protein
MPWKAFNPEIFARAITHRASLASRLARPGQVQTGTPPIILAASETH